MNPVQTLIVDKKKFAIIPYKQYQSLIDTIEDLKDVYEIKKRKSEKRISLEDVKLQMASKQRK